MNIAVWESFETAISGVRPPAGESGPLVFHDALYTVAAEERG